MSAVNSSVTDANGVATIETWDTDTDTYTRTVDGAVDEERPLTPEEQTWATSQSAAYTVNQNDLTLSQEIEANIATLKTAIDNLKLTIDATNATINANPATFIKDVAREAKTIAHQTVRIAKVLVRDLDDTDSGAA